MARKARELLRIVSINDVYDLSNLSRFGSLLQHARRGSHTTLTVVNGDFLSPNVLSHLDKGRAVVDVFNALGVSHCCLGNHEADVGIAEIKKRAAQFRGKWLNSNVPDLTGSGIVPYDVVTTAGGHRVGLIGLLLDDRRAFRDGTFKGLAISPPLSVARQLSATLRSEGVDVVLPLTHLNVADDRELAGAGLGFPVILGGHEHDVIVETVSGCTIVKAGSDCNQAAVCDITLPGDKEVLESGGVSVSVRIEEVKVWAEDAAVSSVMKKHLEVLEQLRHEAICSVRPNQTHLIPLSSQRCRLQPTTMGTLVATACREELGVECAVINGASIAGNRNYPDGTVSFHDLKLELPFPTKMVCVWLPGRVLLEAIRFSRQSEEQRGFLQCDDACALPDGLTLSRVAGKELEADRAYSVGLPRNLVKGFASVQPLIEWGKANPAALPGEEDYRTAYALVVQHYAMSMWLSLGAFNDIDQDHNGLLDREEVAAAVGKRLGRSPSNALVAALMNALDVDGDGVISVKEFAALRARHLSSSNVDS